MINNFNDNKLIPKDILSNSSYLEFVTNPTCRVSGSSLDDLIDRCLTKIRYTVANQQHKHKINERRNRIIDSFTRPIANDENWRYHLLTTPTIIGSCRSFVDALHATIMLFYDKYLLLLFGHLEHYSFIDTYYFLSNENNKTIHDDLYHIWCDSLISTLDTVDRTMMNRDVIEIPLFFNLRFPCATTEYGILRQIRDTTMKRSQDDERIQG
ncbi:unnamed protein product, partial [Rotaria magnacalcarata]